MPMEGLIWTTLISRDLLNDVMHPDAMDYYLHPEGKVHALMFPLAYLLQQFLTPEGTSEAMWRPRFKDGDGDVNDAHLSQRCSYVGVTSFRFMEFMDAFINQMKKMLTTLGRDIFSKYGFNTKDTRLKQFRAPNHPLWGTCLTVSLVRAGKMGIFVRLPMDTRYTNPVTGCRAVLTDMSLAYEPGVLVAHAQTQNQDGTVEITAATAVPEELLLEHDWWIRNEWKVEEARVMYEILAQHTEAVNLMRASSLDPTRMPEVINLKRAAFAVDYEHKQLTRIRSTMPGLLRGHSLWNFIIREEAMEKFRMYFRLSHILGVQTTKEEQEQYFCSVPPRSCVSFASHEYRVVYLTYGGVAKNRKGNWQWDSNDARYCGEVVGKGFFFYWYGLISIDPTSGLITGGIVFSSTAPSPLSALKSDFARQRVEQDAEMFTKGTVADLLRKNEREQRQRRRKEAKTIAPSSSAFAATNQEGKEDTRGKVLSSPGVDAESSNSEEEAGAQDEQDRATEGPLGARKIAKYSPFHK
eukprot:6474391-Amphidinium_carterae.1